MNSDRPCTFIALYSMSKSLSVDLTFSRLKGSPAAIFFSELPGKGKWQIDQHVFKQDSIMVQQKHLVSQWQCTGSAPPGWQGVNCRLLPNRGKTMFLPPLISWRPFSRCRRPPTRWSPKTSSKPNDTVLCSTQDVQWSTQGVLWTI